MQSGRVAYVSNGLHKGKLVTIVDVIDQNRVRRYFSFYLCVEHLNFLIDLTYIEQNEFLNLHTENIFILLVENDSYDEPQSLIGIAG